MDSRAIGIFDSGIGGLSVLNSCRKILNFEDYLYLADTAFAPYGTQNSSLILERSFVCVNKLINCNCKAIVVACNTATNVAIESLRKNITLPLVGLEPALKPATDVVDAAIGDRMAKRIVILCTNATSQQTKFISLLHTYNEYNIVVSPQKNLATLIENNMTNLNNIRPQIYQILSPFEDAYAIVLGCTHYVFIKKIISDFFNGRINIFDGNSGAANRLKYLLAKDELLNNPERIGGIKFIE